jgi:hypothetical protein
MTRILLYFFIAFSFMYIFFRQNSKEHLRVVNEIDQKRAVKEALKTLCTVKGYSWYEMGDEFTYDCKHTKETCLRDSIYPTPEDGYPQYYEWRDASHKDAKDTGINTVEAKTSTILSSDFAGSTNIKTVDTVNHEGGVCILGNEYFRKMCEDEKLTYDPSTGECKTNYDYCHSKQLPFCNGDCFMDPGTWVVDKILGGTIAKAWSNVTLSRAITEAACPKT